MASVTRAVVLGCGGIITWSVLSTQLSAQQPEPNSAPGLPAALAQLDVPGGLVVQWGDDNPANALQLARTGRYVVQLLSADAGRAQQLRGQIAQQHLEGLVTVQLSRDSALPYTENLVNLVLLERQPDAQQWADLARVLRPDGLVIAGRTMLDRAPLTEVGLRAERTELLGADLGLARKPWPPEMDEWTHPRHSASGNAVSQDLLVAPPRRIRWLAGPWSEVPNLVTIKGRNFYGGLLARDGFNGLRLWNRSVTGEQNEFQFRAVRGSAPPVTGAACVYVYADGKLQALDSGTGESVQQYPEAGKPQQILFDAGALITVDDQTVRCLDAQSGRPLWSHGGTNPRQVVAGDGVVGFIQGDARRGETCEVVVLDLRTGQPKWRRADFDWAQRAVNSVYHRGTITFEVSSLNDDGPDNSIHIVATADGQLVRELSFLPGMNHRRQARAMFVDDQLWLLEGGKNEEGKREPIEAVALNLTTGEESARHAAGLTHCFPPVATTRFLFSGELDLTDLQTGEVDANRITKAACGRDAGWFPAHGLIYVTPKHCVCWPMLRGYAALAPARPGGHPADQPVDQLPLPLESAGQPPALGPVATDQDWPLYRHDAWRSGSTLGGGPDELSTLWQVDLGSGPDLEDSPILADWDEDPYVKGPVTAPVIAGQYVYVARSHARQVVALDRQSGAEQWRFTAEGRVDTPPTVYRGLCLLGCSSGQVYCLRADDGQLVWRLQVAPLAEQIVAYGQLESPWPVPGSVLVVDDVAYFAAGRQSFADGGILVCAVDPATGRQQWVRRLDTVPQAGYYTSSALEFDNFDLLHREGEAVAMSRWVFQRTTGEMTADTWRAFARLDTGQGAAMVPQGCWSYAPRNQSRTKTYSPRRPLVVFRDRTLVGCTEDKHAVYRRDFQLEDGEEFNERWITGWENSNASRSDAVAWRSQRLAENARWQQTLFNEDSSSTINALVMTPERLYAAGTDGQRLVIDTASGQVVTQTDGAPLLWDGLAVAHLCVYATTQQGQVLCLGAGGR